MTFSLSCSPSCKRFHLVGMMIVLSWGAAISGCSGLKGPAATPRTASAAYAEANYEKHAEQHAAQAKIAKAEADAPVGPDTLFSAFR